MAGKRARLTGKGASGGGLFVMLRHDLIDHPDYIALSFPAKVLLVDVLRQLKFRKGETINNGDLSITLKVMRPYGWNSNDTLTRATRELIEAGLLIQTRQGGRHKCSLYGVTWFAIDECGGKLDIAPTRTPLRPLSLKIKTAIPGDGTQAA